MERSLDIPLAFLPSHTFLGILNIKNKDNSTLHTALNHNLIKIILIRYHFLKVSKDNKFCYDSVR